MKEWLEQQKESIEGRHRRKKRWSRLVSVLSAATVFVTTYALILPAITLERDPAVSTGAEPVLTEPQLPASTVPGEPQLSETQPESEPFRPAPEEPSPGVGAVNPSEAETPASEPFEPEVPEPSATDSQNPGQGLSRLIPEL